MRLPRYYSIKGLLLADDARRKARRVLVQVDDGFDPAAERRATEGGQGSFAELADQYLVAAKAKNKSWATARRLMERHALPAWGKRPAASIAMPDVERLIAKIESPSTANQVLENTSAIFTWAKKKHILPANPCSGIDRHKLPSRERIASDSEITKLLTAFERAGMRGLVLKTILLTGQRGIEVRHMRREHLRDNWWTMPGPVVVELGWPGTKNAQHHRVWLPEPVRKIIAEVGDEPAGFVFDGGRGRPVSKLDGTMREICAQLGITDLRPHDLRRTFCSFVTRLKFGRDAMDRISNHKETGRPRDVYDRNDYHDEDRQIMERVAAFLLAGPTTNVVALEGFAPAA
jgi:integrase